jgi:hypothetical protein
MLTMITFEIATIFFFMREMFQKETQIKDHQVWNGTIFFWWHIKPNKKLAQWTYTGLGPCC